MGSVGIKYPSPVVSLTEHPATLPKVEIPDDIDQERVVTAILPSLLDLNVDALAENAIWRDQLALTGTFRTFYSPELVAKTWRHLCKQSTISNLAITAGTSQILRFGSNAWLQASFTFTTSGGCPAKCSGTIGIIPHNGTWKIWLFTTILEQPLGFPNVDKLEPGPSNLDTNSLLDCVVVGGASAGLSLAGRLKSLGLSYAVLEQHAEVGDIWTKHRYDSATLHTSREYNQLPGSPRPFRLEDPYYLSSHDLAAGFKRYVSTFGINILTSTTVSSAKFDYANRVWTIVAQSNGKTSTFRARHLVLATGSMGSNPIIPKYSNPEKFLGSTLHTLEWKTPPLGTASEEL
jgi:hypothetical protein